ncbi:KpsF/GutQ family sugar-phosphate isomerase [Nitratireductor indicus]|uniref:KpsF/GutQ family protein n=1 Tax=Nitratireductor indicus C115 TaxID=1231190 RepID=K2N4S7_9HYPH|nr:KpsF/GutQ family sugar-phosphate isomerase [Nitratireductor indicus]EKF42393.1 KpsF/GutQ family protein [Nitratireductor indicus C115]MDS1137900.1 KpsF/GutQ family sugar-phosphate isomerase [Nitratireductor indicus]SFQ55564.1 arabinose-5-phosphate isomerase [Nitratireductor indicus]
MLRDTTLTIDRRSVIASAVRTLETERAGLKALAEALDNGLAEPFAAAVQTIIASKGRVIVTGVGKSGHIGSKIAATLASTGTPAFFVHPAEANHGDLGMIAPDDVIIAMSWSGETSELHGIVAYARRFAIPIIAVTAGKTSALAREAAIVLGLPRAAEACPHGLAPTTSTVLQLVMGDALAVALLEARGFTADHFRTFHPGGQLGAKLTQVRNIMHQGEKLPLAASGTLMREAILVMTQKGFGCVGITDPAGMLIGIITDGDLRRHIDSELLSMSVDQVMTRNPKTIGPETLAESALQIINSSAITTLMVVDEGKPCGVVHLHDLLRIGAA